MNFLLFCTFLMHNPIGIESGSKGCRPWSVLPSVVVILISLFPGGLGRGIQPLLDHDCRRSMGGGRAGMFGSCELDGCREVLNRVPLDKRP